MITLLTGFPGNGKTLYLLSWIEKWARDDKRPVYYSGIEFTPAGAERFGEWSEFEATQWNECPPGSIIVIDECQRIFRNRSINAAAPKFVTDLETHRHLGVDLVFVTQHPMLVDPALRRLTGQHKHCVRTFGMEGSMVHEWPQVRENCDKPAGRKDSIAKPFKFDKSIYGLYKSAEQHTMKRNLPWKVKMLLILPFVLAALVYLIWKSMTARFNNQPSEQEQSMPVAATAPATLSGNPYAFDPVADAKKYVFDRTPRVVGLPHTAPRYDSVTAPVIAPIPAACIEMQGKCRCYTQQGTLMQTEPDMCREIVARGFFVDFDDGSEKQAQKNQSAQPYYVRADALRVPASGRMVIWVYWPSPFSPSPPATTSCLTKISGEAPTT